MTPRPPRPRRRLGRTAAAVAAAGWLAAVPLGCESLRHAEPQSPPPAETAAAPHPAAPKRPGRHWHRAGRYVFHSDAPLDAADPLYRELEDLPDQIGTELALPPGDTLVQVYLFADQDGYDGYMRAWHPKLPSRRAYFMAERRSAGGDDLYVYTWASEHLRTDLRHELTHATLHAALRGVPLWLDEGLAGFFELPPGGGGVNPGHLEILRRGPFLPDLARLEKLGEVKHMEKPEYREAWAWVHLMLRGEPAARRVLLDYVQQLRTTANPGPLLPKLKDAVGDPHLALAAHLAAADLPAVTSARGRVGK